MSDLTENILDAIPSIRMLIVGDVMLDQFVVGEILRMSPEAPAPVFTVTGETEMLGGAANAARAAAALDANATVIGVVGADDAADKVRALLKADGIEDGLVTAGDRPTTRKVRFVSSLDNTHLLRSDWESTQAIQEETARNALRKVAKSIEQADVVLVSDYGKGMLSEPVLRRVIEQGNAAGIPVVVDPKGNDYSKYRDATYITPNLAELEAAVGRDIGQDGQAIATAAREIIAATDVRAVIVKRSAEGVQYVDLDTTFHMPSVATSVIDVSGAGDTLATTFALALATGASVVSSLQVANAAAGMVVGKKGTAAVKLSELLNDLSSKTGMRPSDSRSANP